MSGFNASDDADDMAIDMLYIRAFEEAEEILMDDGNEWKKFTKLQVYALLGKRRKFEEELEKIKWDMSHE
jgi:hypothetical protein